MPHTYRCDLLEKSYFCSIANNKNSYTPRMLMLWFAWKIVLLQYRKQLHRISFNNVPSCDLLEKSYFCSIANNQHIPMQIFLGVVICLKNRTFAVSQTTVCLVTNGSTRCDLLEKSYFCSIANNRLAVLAAPTELWFAWKIVLLQYRKQLGWKIRWSWGVVICLKNRTFAVSQTTITSPTCTLLCCDLLEKSYFCSIANNFACGGGVQWAVVICLKNRTFAVSQTTTIFARITSLSLWFAWKIVLLQYRKQHQERVWVWETVVICLKNRTFAVSQTTKLGCWILAFWLWFAWKIVLLQYRKQQTWPSRPSETCCDLLEKSYFCSIANNGNKIISNAYMLWFAWKIVLLQYRKQPV